MTTTPAPEKLDSSTIKYVTNLIEANPRSEKLQNVISTFTEKYPDDFEGIVPVPLKNLTKDEKEKRHLFIRTAKECNNSDSDTTGSVLVRANACRDTTFDQLEADITNFFDRVTGPGSAILNMPNEIKNISNVMTRTMTKFTNKMTGGLNDKLEEIISGGFGKLANKVFSKVSKSFPYSKALSEVTGIQEKLMDPISALFNGISCVSGKIVDALSGVISDLVTAAIKNVTNVPACAVQEIMGAINNKITNMIDAVATPLLGPIEKILNLGFNVKNFLMSGIDVMKKVDSFTKCSPKPACPTGSKYIIGKGIKKGANNAETKNNFDKMFSGTALSQAATNLASDFEKEYGAWQVFGNALSEASDIGPCYTGNPLKCGAPTVEIFGGGGVNGAGKVILGKFVDRLDTEDIYGAVRRTASIAGVQITNKGSGYSSEPIVTFQDNCNEGYGAYGRAHIDHNPQSPTYGQITGITMITSGENYPAEEEQSLFVDTIFIENSGEGYEQGDSLDDFDLQITDGRVTDVKLRNQIAYNDLPTLNINSATGVGAVLRPVMSTTRPQGEVIQVIDCIGKVGN